MSDISAADLRKLLKQAEAREQVESEQTPHTILLADLADHRVDPGQLGKALTRVFDALELLGVDLLAEGGPAKVGTKPTTTQATTADDTKKGAK